ncbi:MAG: hypothetical protein AAFO96_25615 [Bacteroidota bacterium]
MSDTTTQTLQISCPNCGSQEVVYDPVSRGLKCNHCGYQKELPQEADQVVEHPLHMADNMDELTHEFGVKEKVFHCENCGADTIFPHDTVRIVCPFCDSEQVNEMATETRLIKPTGVLPFTITKEAGLASYKQWLSKGWFAPNNLRKVAKIDRIHGMYLPFWTFDAFTRSRWTAQAGYYYYVSESYTDAEGNRRTRQVRKIRWKNASGYLEQFFDDVFVVASHGVGQELMERILPYELNETVNFDEQFLLGWDTELYQKDVKEGFRTADAKMDDALYAACARQVPGDTHRFLRVDTDKEGLTFKHLLLPIWLASYQYKDKVYQFIVNGQTGAVAGRKPKSWWKIALAVLAGIIVVGGIVLLSQNGA